MQHFIKRAFRFLLRRLHIDLVPSNLPKQEEHRVKLLKLLDIGLVVDVGANIGQYTIGLFSKGFKGEVISFEPVSDVYQRLLLKSKQYTNWTIYERCAVGDKPGEIEINVSENYESSSIYNVLEKSVIAEPLTNFIKKEKVKIVRLSDVAELKDYTRLHLKIDVQGYEEIVLKGAEEILSKVCSLEVEISLVPLYDGALLPEVLLVKLKEYSFLPVFFTSAFTDSHTGAIMQLDGFFVKRELIGLIPK